MTRFPVCLALVCLLPLVGCTPKISTGGEDSDYLKDHSPPTATATSTQVFPLAPGNYWEMDAISDGDHHQHKIVVVGPKQVGAVTGMYVQYLRDGALWRQEVYRNDDQGLFLLAYGEKKPELLVLDPPLPILKARLEEGTEVTWAGNVRFQANKYPATGFSRISSPETLTTRKGRFQAYRLDSVITMSRPGTKSLHFPSVRWLSKDIGLVSRQYADGGKPAAEVLEKYMVQGK
jgi:hypothetical protein